MLRCIDTVEDSLWNGVWYAEYIVTCIENIYNVMNRQSSCQLILEKCVYPIVEYCS